MKQQTVALLLALALSIAGCSDPGSHVAVDPPVKTTETPIEGLSQYALGDPVSSGNVQIVPVLGLSLGDRKLQDYTTLSQAKAAGTVEIVELPGEEEVDTLLVRNTGDRPLMLLGGELLLGGKQDRVVAKDTIVKPGEERRVPVFCVEHGRWSGDYGDFKPSGTTVPSRVRLKALHNDQEDVWSSVSEFNDRAGAAPELSSVRGGLEEKEVARKMRDSFSDLSDQALRDPRTVGVVIVVNGQIVSLELFGSHELLAAHWPTLLRGTLAEAATSSGGDATTPDRLLVAAFIRDALSGEASQSAQYGFGSEWRSESAKGRGVWLNDSEARSSSEGLIHGSFAAPERTERDQGTRQSDSHNEGS